MKAVKQCCCLSVLAAMHQLPYLFVQHGAHSVKLEPGKPVDQPGGPCLQTIAFAADSANQDVHQQLSLKLWHLLRPWTVLVPLQMSLRHCELFSFTFYLQLLCNWCFCFCCRCWFGCWCWFRCCFAPTSSLSLSVSWCSM